MIQTLDLGLQGYSEYCLLKDREGQGQRESAKSEGRRSGAGTHTREAVMTSIYHGFGWFVGAMPGMKSH